VTTLVRIISASWWTGTGAIFERSLSILSISMTTSASMVFGKSSMSDFSPKKYCPGVGASRRGILLAAKMMGGRSAVRSG
jgi:hypothetical protein